MPKNLNLTSEQIIYPDRIPFTVGFLTGLGLVPFAALALGAVFLPPDSQQSALHAQQLYGAVILSFLGGIYWGWELAVAYVQTRPVSSTRLIIGVLPSVFGWFALLLPGVYPALALSACFCGCLAYDLWRTNRHLAPRWYPALRIPVTVAVLVALITPVFPA
ncbi:DUF3429 domain-containing protein [Labrenzia sp. PHM005]|uniref:DUF3429 domain-containing protein n=1 Tax=Labrenzia sp. PHM005 TaxID=2590016 RepID=UPI00143DE476